MNALKPTRQHLIRFLVSTAVMALLFGLWVRSNMTFECNVTELGTAKKQMEIAKAWLDRDPESESLQREYEQARERFEKWDADVQKNGHRHRLRFSKLRP